MPTRPVRDADLLRIAGPAAFVVRGQLTRLLFRMGEGRDAAGDEVFTAVYDLLRAQARSAMRKQDRTHTLQPTDLANAAFLKLVKRKSDWNSRAHFLAMAAHAMRSILVDHARTKRRRKRKSTGRAVELDQLLVSFEDHAINVLAVDEAMRRLAVKHERASRVVELRFFGGLEFEDIAELMDVRVRTIERDWNFARAWLHAELS